MTKMNLIRRIAWSYSHTTGLDIDDLFSVAAIGYTKALNTYDPERSCFSTWAWINMSRELNNYLAGMRPDPHAPRDHEELSPEDAVGFKETIASMGKEAREICEIIFESPYEFIADTPKTSRGKIRDGLRERGWGMVRIWRGIEEIKQTLTEMT